MGLRPTQGDESRSHTDRAAAGEVSAVPERGELMQILRYAQNDRLSREQSAAKNLHVVTSLPRSIGACEGKLTPSLQPHAVEFGPGGHVGEDHLVASLQAAEDLDGIHGSAA